MDFGLTDEQELLVESIKEFAERYYTEDKIAEMYQNHGTPDEILQAYMEAGFAYMGFPEEYDGIPCDNVTLGLLIEELAHYTGSTTPFMNNTLSMLDMIKFGSEDQIKLSLDAYKKTNKPMFSLGFSEPAAGSDNAAMTCVTKKQEDGTYLLKGQKTWVTMGEYFPYILTIAKDEDSSRDNKAMSMWLISKDAEGVSTAPLYKIGQQIMPFCEVYYDDVVLTEDMRVGEAGKGFFNLMKNYEAERCFICAQNLGLAQAAMDDAASYASERMTFGKTISDHQLIQEKLTDMETVLQNCRNMLYKTLWKIDTNQSIRVDSALLKRYCGQKLNWVTSEAMQIYGGLGFTTETRLGRLWADTRGNDIAGGTGEIMVYIAGRQIAKQYARQ